MEKIATYNSVNYYCQKYNLKAKKGYGQNFIIDYNTVDRIADSATNENDCVIEIGPGIGSLTQPLALKCKHVYAFEIDERCVKVLQESLKDLDNVTVIQQDFLTCDLDSFVDELSKKYDCIRVCSNLPYYITTAILFKLFECKYSFASITVMMQKEVANRFLATPSTKDYNALSVISQYRCNVSPILDVSRKIFNPSPNVDSKVIQFKPKEKDKRIIDENEFYSFVKICFTQRRKTLMNNIKGSIYNRDNILQWIKDNKDNESIRSEQLSLDDFIDLYLKAVQ